MSLGRRGTRAAHLIWLLLLPCCACRVHFEYEESCRWHELDPLPTPDAIDRFRENYPATPVTTTQPNTWNKIEVGMSRGMVRALVGERLHDPRRHDAAVLDQNPPPHTKWWIKLYFTQSPSDDTPSAEDDILDAIIVLRKVDRPMGSTDWP